MSLLLLAAAVAATASANSAIDEVEAEFRRSATDICPRILSQRRAFFQDEAQLAAAKLTISPIFKSMLAVPSVPVSVEGKSMVLMYQDHGNTRNTKVMCMVSGRPGVNVIALRDRFFMSLTPTLKMVALLKRDEFVGFPYVATGDVKAHVIVFWRDSVFVKPPEEVSR